MKQPWSDLLGVLFFLMFTALLIAVLPDDFELSGVGSALLLVLLFAGMGIAAGLLAGKVNRWLARKKYERRVARALSALSMSVEEVLDASPYTFIGNVRPQGEEYDFAIVRKDAPAALVDVATSEAAATLWIVERYLAAKTEVSSITNH